jgi:magnesium transporter
MIRVMLYEPQTSRFTEGGQELLDVWKTSDDATVWVDLVEVPAEVEKPLMTGYFGLHPLAIQDAQRDRHPPKVEAFEDHTFVLLKGLDAQSQDIHFGTIQIAIFVGARFLLTRHSGESPSIDRLWAQAQADTALIARGPDALAVMLSRIIVNRYLPILLALEARLDQLEDEMMAHPTDRLLAELVGHKANLKKLRRVIGYHVRLFEAIKSLMPPGIREELRHDITDVYEHLERSMSLATLYYELASDLMDGYITLASHRLNQIVKILTIVTTIFVPLSFLAGIYGMNFENMPELKTKYGYFVLLGMMAATATGALLIMYRLGWMGEKKDR